MPLCALPLSGNMSLFPHLLLISLLLVLLPSFAPHVHAHTAADPIIPTTLDDLISAANNGQWYGPPFISLPGTPAPQDNKTAPFPVDDDDVFPHPSISNNNVSHSPHVFKSLQAGESFYMERRTQVAPWSGRIQPAFLYMTKAVTYRLPVSGILVSTGDSWVLLFEGSLSYTTLNDSNENDVWMSADDGQSWSLIGGISRRGMSGVVPAWNPASFTGRGGSNNCEDPGSDAVWSIGGYAYNATVAGQIRSTNEVWKSTDGRHWTQEPNSNMPTRYFSSCDVDMAGHVYSMGGAHINTPTTLPDTLLNDVWSNVAGGWVQMTARAPWTPRVEHLTMIASGNKFIGREIIYVIGGTIGQQGRGLPNRQANDVWASSDQGVTWSSLSSNAPFGPRWGHGGVVTSAGVLLIWGGANTDTGNYGNTYSYRDVWASFDGGINWKKCNAPSDNLFIRAEQSATLDGQERLVLATGYQYNNPGRIDYRDVWRTPFSLSDPQVLASMCPGATINKAGVGLRAWPRTGNLQDKILFSAVTFRAPWSPRMQPGILRMSRAINYTQVGTGITLSTPSNWLLMYEGGIDIGQEMGTAENDVWSSGDNGATWDLIAGVSQLGYRGLVRAAKSTRSFEPRVYSNNCEDPLNDDVYSIGGLSTDGLTTNELWYSSDAIEWVLHAGRNPLPPSFSSRMLSSCAIDDHNVMYVMGGMMIQRLGNVPRLLNDVWQGRQQGRQWTLVCENAPWAARAEHSMIHSHSPTLKKDIIWVIAGFTSYNLLSPTGIKTTNDVWASSDGGVTWAAINAAPVWGPRAGQAAIMASTGVMLLLGGGYTRTGSMADANTYREVWMSYDGGYVWVPCGIPSGVDWIRTEQAIQLTSDERIILAGGMTFISGLIRSYADVYLSDLSLADLQKVIEVCPLNADNPTIPTSTGLTTWPGQGGTGDSSSGSDGKLSGAMVAGIVFLIIGVGVVCWCCYSSYQKTGRLPIPQFIRDAVGIGGGETSDTPVDYSAFTVLGTKDNSTAEMIQPLSTNAAAANTTAPRV